MERRRWRRTRGKSKKGTSTNLLQELGPVVGAQAHGARAGGRSIFFGGVFQNSMHPL